MATSQLAGTAVHNSSHIFIFLFVCGSTIHEKQKTIRIEKHIGNGRDNFACQIRNKKLIANKNSQIVYNAVQVVLSVYLVIEGLEGGWRKHYNFRCQPVDYSNNPVAIRVNAQK